MCLQKNKTHKQISIQTAIHITHYNKDIVQHRNWNFPIFRPLSFDFLSELRNVF